MTTTFRFNDPRLPLDSERPTFLGRHRCADDPVGDSLELLRSWHHDLGVPLKRRHVETAARLTGADFGLLWDTVLSPAAAR